MARGTTRRTTRFLFKVRDNRTGKYYTDARRSSSRLSRDGKTWSSLSALKCAFGSGNSLDRARDFTIVVIDACPVGSFSSIERLEIYLKALEEVSSVDDWHSPTCPEGDSLSLRHGSPLGRL